RRQRLLLRLARGAAGGGGGRHPRGGRGGRPGAERARARGDPGARLARRAPAGQALDLRAPARERRRARDPAPARSPAPRQPRSRPRRVAVARRPLRRLRHRPQMKELWSRIGGGVGRLWLALAVLGVAGGLLVLQGLFLRDRMRIKVEASALLPADHPKNKEFELIRHAFKGSSRGFYVAVEAPPARLRAVVPEVARALEAL